MVTVCKACGTAVMGENVCPVCGAAVQYNTPTVTQSAPASTTTRSRMVAILLIFLGINDLYLGFYSKFVKKVLVGLCTFLVGWIVWQVIDLIKLLTGGISCDANGNPLV